jgi:hypothetical protein
VVVEDDLAVFLRDRVGLKEEEVEAVVGRVVGDEDEILDHDWLQAG